MSIDPRADLRVHRNEAVDVDVPPMDKSSESQYQNVNIGRREIQLLKEDWIVFASLRVLVV